MNIISRTVTLDATPNTLAQLSVLVAALSPAVPATGRFIQLMVIPVGAGNLAMTDDSTEDAEAGAAIIPAAGIVLGPLGTGQGYVELGKMYFISATASKAFYLIGISES